MKKLFLLLLLSVVFINCSEDFFKVKVPITLPPHISKPVIIADLDGTKSYHSIFVTKTRRFDDVSPYNFLDQFDTIENALITIQKEGEVPRNIQYSNGYFQNLYPFEPGKQYTIRLNSKEYSNVFGIAKMPYPVKIDKWTYKPKYILNPNNDFGNNNEKIDELAIEINDPVGESNYYAFDVLGYYNKNDTIGYLINLEYLDPIAIDNLITDKGFNGNKYLWRFGINNNSRGYEKIKIILKSISAEKYKYELSKRVYENTKDNPFSEPTILYSNIENGLGVFSVLSSVTDTLNL
jgi:Domain of unknown function (DUF4249)